MHSRLFDKLFKAAAEGDAAGIVRLRARCRSVLIQDDDDNTPLHLAARGGHTAAVYELLKREGSVAAKVCNLAEETPFTLAVQYGHPEIVRMLLHAADFDEQEAVNLLIEAGARLSLNEMVRLGDVRDVQVLLDSGADVNEQTLDYQTPLLRAIDEQNPAMVRILLAAGADANLSTMAGTPLTEAAWRESSEIVQMLIEAGANVNTLSYHGSTALLETIILQRTKNLALLIRAGADVNQVGAEGVTPLAKAKLFGRDDIIRPLLAAGADPGSEVSP